MSTRTKVLNTLAIQWINMYTLNSICVVMTQEEKKNSKAKQLRSQMKNTMYKFIWKID